MLSDEEKRAIEFVKSELQDEKVRVDYQRLTGLYGNLEIEILLNLIDKQSKEIEELKNITKSYDSFLGTEKIVIADKNFFVNGYFKENFVRKDKIKAKIEPKLKELDKQINEEWKKYGNSKELQDMEDMYNFLQSLLEKE